jgi:hypothetical protein
MLKSPLSVAGRASPRSSVQLTNPYHSAGVPVTVVAVPHSPITNAPVSSSIEILVPYGTLSIELSLTAPKSASLGAILISYSFTVLVNCALKSVFL